MDSFQATPNPELAALKLVIDLCGGSRAELIRRLRAAGHPCSDSLVYVWEKRDLKVSHSFVIPVAQVVDWAVTPNELAPALYPHADDGLPDHLRNRAVA